MRLTLRQSATSTCDRIVSGGKAFDPGFFRELAIRKDWSVGGRGILIMHELMDEVSFFFVPGHRTTVMLVKRLQSAGKPSPVVVS